MVVLLLLLLLLFQYVHADVYLHNPRGSNDRGCETNTPTRDNPQRLFDSENNAQGGYSCPRAWPFSCYTIPTESDRDTCNMMNADQDYDDIYGLGMMDDEGVLSAKGTRTPKMYYYEGSILQIEWTNQHGCGQNPKTHCDIILQYACEDTLTDDCGEPDSGLKCGPRDGLPITNYSPSDNRGSVTFTNIVGNGQQNVDRRARDRDVSSTIPFSIQNHAQMDPRFARHETLEYYLDCFYRQRNMGLYIADQNLQGNGAIFTRQNAAGTRYGLECPEERDYYPYWAPSPWKDIAILTDRYAICNQLVSQSQNIMPSFTCNCPTCLTANPGQTGIVPNNAQGCTSVGGSWVQVPAHNIPAPVCGQAPTTRENHLGNPIGGGKSGSSFNWTLPKNLPAGTNCVLRIRYNISTGDIIPATGQAVTLYGTSAQNGGNSPLKDRQNSQIASYYPFIEMPIQSNPSARLGLEVNTNQYGRTFQDRSWSFEIRPAPSSGYCAGRTIYNLNVRGKRGNIVSVYPAVEYDFSPNEFYMTDADCIHVQWTGSDYNPATNSNDAYGGPPEPTNLNNGRSDRHNMVQTSNVMYNSFVSSLDYNWNMFNTNRDRKVQLAFINQPIDDTTVCMPIESIAALSTAQQNNPTAEFTDQGTNFIQDNNGRDRYWQNCGKLSGARTPYFDGGLFQPGAIGMYSYMSTRSNSFSNRDQIGIIHVQSSLLASGSVVFVVMGGGAVLAIGMAGMISFRRRQHRTVAAGAPGAGLVALLPFGRRNSPAIAGANEPTTPMIPRRARPGTVSASPASGGTAVNKVESTSPTVTALHNHQATEAGELEFRKGDIITVLRKDDSGWWEGRTPDGKKGIFPANYVK